MVPFLGIGTLTTLYILWALAAYPTEIFAKGNSIVYINPATNNTALNKNLENYAYYAAF
jgi:hypothetical protein